jgi:hypothetical protein
MAEARLAKAQKRMAALHNEMVDLRIRYDEAVTDAKESGESWWPSSSMLVRTKRRPRR